MTLSVFLLALGATARLTRFVTDDYLARYFRAWVIRKAGPQHDISYGIACPWCLGLWVAGAILPVAWWFGEHPGFVIPAAALSVSWLYGIAASLLDGDD